MRLPFPVGLSVTAKIPLSSLSEFDSEQRSQTSVVGDEADVEGAALDVKAVVHGVEEYENPRHLYIFTVGITSEVHVTVI